MRFLNTCSDLSDLVDELIGNTDHHESDKKPLVVRPFRTYIEPDEAGYDWACGRTFLVVDDRSPLRGNKVATDETNNLRRHGYTHVKIRYNNSSFLELPLDNRS